MTPYVPAVELIYRSLAEPKPQEAKPYPSEAKEIELTRDDISAIIHRRRTATPDELQFSIAHGKQFKLTDNERNQIACDLTIAMSQRACQANQRREDPGAQFISQTLKLLSTPHGLIEREWFDNLLHTNVEAIAKCRTHKIPRCDCWRGAREMLWHAAHTHGDDSPEAWTALQVWTILEELEISSRPER